MRGADRSRVLAGAAATVALVAAILWWHGAFAGRYGYDVSYLEMLLNESASAFFKFAPLMKASAHREVVPVEASFAAKITGGLAEDCGPCTQLVVDMALEAGMA